MKKRKYRLTGGTHVESSKPGEDGEIQIYKSGEEVISSRPLDKLFKNKFVDLGEVEEVINIESEPKLETDKPNKTTSDSDAPGVSKVPEGYDEDVTEEFEGAEAKSVKVFRNGSWYGVFEPDDLSEPIDGKKLRKNDVSDFINDLEDE